MLRVLGCARNAWRKAALGLSLSLLAPIVWPGSLAAKARSETVAETVKIDGPISGLKLGLRHVRSTAGTSSAPMVLILHGTNVPTSGNADYPFGGRSWMAALAETGLDVWGLDFYGFGTSDRYPEMSEAPDRHPPLGQAAESADQVEATVRFLQSRNGGRPITLIGDSGGSLVAGVYATRKPATVSRLVLFGPVTSIATGEPPSNPPAYRLVTPDKLWVTFARWSTEAGAPQALDPTAYKDWAATFLAGDPTSSKRSPPSVKIPNGRAGDSIAIAPGRFPYDPAKIVAPTLVVMGETDEVTTFPGAQWLLGALRNAPQRRLVVIGHASHTIQFEAERNQLYDVLADFLHGEDASGTGGGSNSKTFRQ